MFSGKFLYTLLAIFLAFFAICKTEIGAPVVENFIQGYHLTVKAMPTVTDKRTCTTSAAGGNYLPPEDLLGSSKFVSVPSFKAMLSPRMSGGINYGANIKYNPPSYSNQGVPCDPLTFADLSAKNPKKEAYIREGRNAPGVPNREGFQFRENYGCGTGQCGDSGVPSCGKGGYGLGKEVGGGYELPVGYTNGNYGDIYDSLTLDGQPAPIVSRPCQDSGCGADQRASLPIGTMSVTDSDGTEDQIVFANNLMYAANAKDRLRAHSDYIRGDLPITPTSVGWFSVYPNINTALNPGALNVLGGGVNNDTNAKLIQLMMNSTGGAQTTLSGVDFSEPIYQVKLNNTLNMATQLKAQLGAEGTDLSYDVEPQLAYTSFP
jgi:hypothetical protein